jgi:hypothetical protein
MILPHIRVVVLHAGRRVAVFISIKSKNRQSAPALMRRDANRSGIIRLTFTA